MSAPVIKSEFVNDDWERIYYDGELLIEGHSISARQLMLAMWPDPSEIKVEFTHVHEED